MNIGVDIRTRQIFSDNKPSIIIPTDDSLISGPIGGLLDFQRLVEVVSNHDCTILGHAGIVKSNGLSFCKIPFILNLSASTYHNHLRKFNVFTVKDAISLGATAVAYHINYSSIYEGEMLSALSDIRRIAHSYGIPVLAIIYPRKHSKDGKDYNYLDVKHNDINKFTSLVSHAVRIVSDLGVDFIKTCYTGSQSSFRHVVEAANNCRIITSGGGKEDVQIVYENALNAVVAGASGVCFGRNTFLRKNPDLFIQLLRKVVNQDMSATEAARVYKDE